MRCPLTKATGPRANTHIRGGGGGSACAPTPRGSARAGTGGSPETWARIWSWRPASGASECHGAGRLTRSGSAGTARGCALAGPQREGRAVSSMPSPPAKPSPVVSGRARGVALAPAAFTGFGNYCPRTGLVSRSQEPPATCGQRPPTRSFLLESPLLETGPAWQGRRGNSLGLCPPHPSGHGLPAPLPCAC